MSSPAALHLFLLLFSKLLCRCHLAVAFQLHFYFLFVLPVIWSLLFFFNFAICGLVMTFFGVPFE